MSPASKLQFFVRGCRPQGKGDLHVPVFLNFSVAERAHSFWNVPFCMELQQGSDFF